MIAMFRSDLDRQLCFLGHISECTLNSRILKANLHVEMRNTLTFEINAKAPNFIVLFPDDSIPIDTFLA